MFAEPTRPRRKHGRKQRRIQNACDVCKKRKVRCDSMEVPGNHCTGCTSLGLDCTHAELVKVLPSANGYVSALESRVEKMEKLLTKLLPGIDFTEQLENEDHVESLIQQHVEALPRNDREDAFRASETFTKLMQNPESHRFVGRSSGVQLLQIAVNFRRDLTEMGPPQFKRSNLAPWLLPPPCDTPQYSFPDVDLLPTLVELYFQNINVFWPLLHRPSFEHKVAQNLHLRDHRFGALLLMVCSVGARHSDDPRVLLEDVEDHRVHSAGWKWYKQVCVIPEHLIFKPDLYELQTIALSSLYLRVISPKTSNWCHIGFGLRRALDVGAHRCRKQPHPTVENEQWKRVFWVLLCEEWVTGTLTGRPMAMHEQDFDQDLPIDCDDEYWDDNFKQPEDRPSEISYFICYAKLLEIQAAVTTTIYSPRKPKDLGSNPFPPTDADYIVAFDSALNSWLNDIPEHLRWDPDRENALHLTQSALLYTAYYNIQILLHRPFIPAPFGNSSTGVLPSLAICTNAARSCIRILDIHFKRNGSVTFDMLPSIGAAAIVLVLNACINKKTDFPPKELDVVYSITSEAEKRFLVAGRLTDLLRRLSCPENCWGVHDDMVSVLAEPPMPPPCYKPFVSPHADLGSTSPSAFVRRTAEIFDLASNESYTTPDSELNSYYTSNYLHGPERPKNTADIAADTAAWRSAFHLDDSSWSHITEHMPVSQFGQSLTSAVAGRWYGHDPEKDQLRELFGFWE
ncbi:fungal-specific transcription factor domain-containing protein [Mycena polygramma]|nr:fungal-specific transcription factor domain-containing protein [Mycena polygramma]